MRLWHQELLTRLPRQQLLGQHRECCALRGNGWGKPHSTVNYVFKYDPLNLYLYHRVVMYEMRLRGYFPNRPWYSPLFRGFSCEPWETINKDKLLIKLPFDGKQIIYKEHDEVYMEECILNLRGKGIEI